MIECASDTSVAASTLSVVLPNYNHARYLPRALDALLTQEYAAKEIIVVDDGSTDGSRDIIKTYIKKYSSVRLIANARNVGAIHALSRGLYEARGQFVYFAAADDFVMPGFFALAIKMLQTNSSAGMFCGEVLLADGISGRIVGVRPPVRPRSFSAGFIDPANVIKLLRRNDNFIATGAAVLRRNAIAWAGGFDEQLSSFADGYLVRKVALTYGFCFAPIVVLTWCVFPDSASRKTATEIDRARLVLGKINARMASDPVYPPWYRDVFVRRWHFSTSRLAIISNPINRELLMGMGAQNAIDRAFFGGVLKLFSGQAGRFLILAWLWLRFRPFSLVDLCLTAFARMLTSSAHGVGPVKINRANDE